MTGPEHYREAERLLTEAVSWIDTPSSIQTDRMVVAVAQVHADLAKAAAIAAPTLRGPGYEKHDRDWQEAVQ